MFENFKIRDIYDVFIYTKVIDNIKYIRRASPKLLNNRRMMYRLFEKITREEDKVFLYKNLGENLVANSEFIIKVLEIAPIIFFELDDTLKTSPNILKRIYKDRYILNDKIKENIIFTFFKNLKNEENKKIIYDNKLFFYNIFCEFYPKYSENLEMFSRLIIEKTKENIIDDLKNNRRKYSKLPSFLKKDKDVEAIASKTDYNLFKRLLDENRIDEKEISESIDKYYENYEYLSPHLKNDKNLILKAVKNKKFVKKYYEKFLDDKEILVEMIKTEPKIYLKLKSELKKDEEIVLNTLIIKPSLYNDVNKEFKYNKEFLWKVYNINTEIYEYLPLILKKEFKERDEENEKK